jgi:hypothetical protein
MMVLSLPRNDDVERRARQAVPVFEDRSAGVFWIWVGRQLSTGRLAVAVLEAIYRRAERCVVGL